MDDEAALVTILRVYLEDEGFDVIDARDGQMGLELALGERDEIVVARDDLYRHAEVRKASDRCGGIGFGRIREDEQTFEV